MAGLDAYVGAMQRGIAWLAAQQNADGSLGEAHATPAMYFYKSANALGLAGRVAEAGRLLDWLRANLLDADGCVVDGAGAGASTYRTSWILLGAHRLSRFDVSAACLDWLRERQQPCGGFVGAPGGEDLNTIFVWAGMAALYAGDVAVSDRTGRFIGRLIEQQPDPSRFYHTASADGRLRVEDDPKLFVDSTAPEQGYYFLGIPTVLLARLHLATGDASHLEAAEWLYAFSTRCAPDAYDYTTSAKSMVGAAILHRITGEGRQREHALEMADFLVRTQDGEGWWTAGGSRDVGIQIDATAEFCIFLCELVSTLAGT